jgi:hypothetical protein
VSESATLSQPRGHPDRGHVRQAVTDRGLKLAIPTRTERGYMIAALSGALGARLLGGSLRLAALRPAVGMAVRAAGLDRLLDIFPTVQSAVSSPARA